MFINQGEAGCKIASIGSRLGNNYTFIRDATNIEVHPPIVLGHKRVASGSVGRDDYKCSVVYIKNEMLAPVSAKLAGLSWVR